MAATLTIWQWIFGVDVALDLGVSWQDVAITRLVDSMDVPMRILDTMFFLDE